MGRFTNLGDFAKSNSQRLADSSADSRVVSLQQVIVAGKPCTQCQVTTVFDSLRVGYFLADIETDDRVIGVIGWSTLSKFADTVRSFEMAVASISFLK